MLSNNAVVNIFMANIIRENGDEGGGGEKEETEKKEEDEEEFWA